MKKLYFERLTSLKNVTISPNIRFSLPYVPGLSEVLSQHFKKFKIDISFSRPTNLNSLLRPREVGLDILESSGEIS